MENNNIDIEIDNLIDSFEVKPITEGLGFHHSLKDKKEVTISLKQQGDSLKNDLETRVDQLDTTTIKHPTSVNMGELAPFYASKSDVSVADEIKLEVSEQEQIVEASLSLRMCAWFIDMGVLLSLMLVTFTAIIYFSDLPLEVINAFMISDEIFLSFGLITVMFYTFYFSFFDKTSYSTPGKKVLNLKVVGINGKMTLNQAFYRSCFSLISIPLLGLPVILKIHDKLTDTVVVENF